MGVYAVKVMLDNKPRVVFLDDYLPVKVKDMPELRKNLHDETRGSFETCMMKLFSSNCFWACLIEKAFAKACWADSNYGGGYFNVQYHASSQTMVTLCPTASEPYSPFTKKVAANLLNFDYVKNMRASEGVWFASASDESENGIVGTHGYSVMELREVDGHRLVKLRNPWGTNSDSVDYENFNNRGEWRGAWSDGSKEWTPRYKKLLNHQDVNDSEFWMPWDDFSRIFGLDFVHTKGCRSAPDQSTGVVVGKKYNNTGGYENQNVPVWNVTCNAACNLTIVFHYMCYPAARRKEMTADIGIQVFKGKATRASSKPWVRSQLIDESEFVPGTAELEVPVEANTTVRVACSTYEEGIEEDGQFIVHFHVDGECTKFKVEQVV
jgi:hypothetical protein